MFFKISARDSSSALLLVLVHGVWTQINDKCVVAVSIKEVQSWEQATRAL